jgi:hypothetical protein
MKIKTYKRESSPELMGFGKHFRDGCFIALGAFAGWMVGKEFGDLIAGYFPYADKFIQGFSRDFFHIKERTGYIFGLGGFFSGSNAVYSYMVRSEFANKANRELKNLEKRIENTERRDQEANLTETPMPSQSGNGVLRQDFIISDLKKFYETRD